MGKDKGQIPAEALAQVNARLIDSGRFLRDIDKNLTRGHKELAEYAEATQTRKGKVRVTATVELAYDEDMTDAVVITYDVQMRVPKRKRGTFVKEKGGRMLCSLEGSTSEHPDQFQLFDRSGVLLGLLNPATGEIEEDADDEESDAGGSAAVAGSIPRAAAVG
jgi:hypothetical protein